MTDQELKDLVASVAISQKKTDKQIEKMSKVIEGFDSLKAAQEKTDKQIAKTDKQIEKMSKTIHELGEHTGGLGKKFGSFTEGMVYPSLEKILRNRFKMDYIAPQIKVRKKTGEEIELDILAYSNSQVNEVYIVEVKSHLRVKGITQMVKNLERFFDFFPDHRGKKLYGIVAAVEAREELYRKLFDKGIYFASIHDNIFKLNVPEKFIPHSYSHG